MEDWTTDAPWAGTRRPVTAATGLDPTAYAGPDFFDVERGRVFERAWVCVGLAADATPGRLLVRTVGARSILILRSADDGQLRGFVNSCRHRGTELAERDCDVGSTIRCPYHRWGYATDGRLVSTPRFEDVPRDEFDPAAHGLATVRVDTWGCLLFACLDDETPPLTDWLGDLTDRMAGYDLSTWVPRDSLTVDIAANWKLISENFQEYYHLPWVHPELAKVSRVADHYRYQGPGMYCGQTTTPVSGDDRDDWLRMPPAPGLDDSDGCSGRFVAIFPNVLLSVLPNHAFVMQLDPTAPGWTRETCTWLLPATTGPLADDEFEPTRQFWLDVNGEDIAIVERSQRGLTHGAVPAGPLAPRFEEPLHRFHNMLADCMTLRSLADLAVPGGDGPDDRYGTAVNPSPPTIDADRV